MADSMAGAQEDATARINGLMGSLGKRTQERDAALSRIAELEAAAQDPATGNSQQPNYQEGTLYRWQDGQMVEATPPTPRHNGGFRDLSGADRDDGSPEWAHAKLAQTLGGTVKRTTWP